MVVPYLTRLRSLDQPSITPRRRSRFEPRAGLADSPELPGTPYVPAGPPLEPGTGPAAARRDLVTPLEDHSPASTPDADRPRSNPPAPLVLAPTAVDPTPAPMSRAEPAPQRSRAEPLPDQPPDQLADEPAGGFARPPVPPDPTDPSPPEPVEVVEVTHAAAVSKIARPVGHDERQPAADASVEPPNEIDPTGPDRDHPVRLELLVPPPPPPPASRAAAMKAERVALQRTATALRRATPVHAQRPPAAPDHSSPTDVWSVDAQPAPGRVPPPVPPPTPTPGTAPAAPTRSEPTTVHVSIGRVEVTGPAAAPAPPPRRAPARTSTSTLDAYLSARLGRQVG